MSTKIFVLVGMLFLLLGLSRIWLDADAIFAVGNNASDTSDTVLVQEVLRKITIGTKFEKRWSVGGSVFDEGLRVYLFKSSDRQSRALKVYKGNYAFTGHRATIICDTRIIDSMQGRWLGSYYPGTSQREIALDTRRYRKFLIAWLLSHEMGHVLAGHPASGFAHGPLDAYVSDLSLREKRELEADSFVVSRFGHPFEQDSDGYYRDLIGAFNKEILISVCPEYLQTQVCNKMMYSVGIILPKNKLETPLGFCAGRSHPDFIVRTIRILKLAQDEYKAKFFGELLDNMYHRDLVKAAEWKCK